MQCARDGNYADNLCNARNGCSFGGKTTATCDIVHCGIVSFAHTHTRAHTLPLKAIMVTMSGEGYRRNYNYYGTLTL